MRFRPESDVSNHLPDSLFVNSLFAGRRQRRPLNCKGSATSCKESSSGGVLCGSVDIGGLCGCRVPWRTLVPSVFQDVPPNLMPFQRKWSTSLGAETSQMGHSVPPLVGFQTRHWEPNTCATYFTGWASMIAKSSACLGLTR